ncbi:hypothetical protein NECAME_08232 [Necator americanus]|uniref:Uncharacterized protein n=1 Tax=Necator americanus TaxID=51031 RepID=W2TIU3_NECAM|nr:hypothetical protein NECAME_08232 [Necator americanus]ETN82025.1 hypothetical protein NECAME_08232 [Necator americanus]
MGMKTEHWDLLGEAITETIREYQGWKRHRESLRAANILVSFLVDRMRTGFLQRDVVTPNGTPPYAARTVKESSDRERSKSLQDSYHGLLYRELAESCPVVKDCHSPSASYSTDQKPKRSMPCMSTSKEARLEIQIHHRRRCLPQTPLSDGEVDNNVDTAITKRRQFRHSANNSFELGHIGTRFPKLSD